MGNDLNKKQKYECVARWLNGLFDAYRNGEQPEAACQKCPLYKKECGENVPPTANFKIIEEITGDGTILSTLIDQRAEIL